MEKGEAPHTPAEKKTHAVFKREMKSMFFKYRGGHRMRYDVLV